MSVRAMLRSVPIVLCALLCVVLAGLAAFGLLAGSDEGQEPLEIADGSGTHVVAETESKRTKRLSSPEERAKRERSQTQFSALPSRAVIEVGGDRFPEHLREPVWEGAKVGEKDRVEDYLGRFSARVSNAKGDVSLVESSVPLVTENAAGESRPVELALEDRGPTYVSRNPLVAVTYPKDPAESIELSRAGVGLQLLGVSDSATSQAIDDRLVVPNALPDTDFWVAPTAGGFETFTLLRSVDSPETTRFQIDLPVGARLAPVRSGGAEVVRGEQPLATIGAPTAWDTDGTQVPVELKVEGSHLVLQVPHRDRDLHYPVLVDPLVEEYEWEDPEWWEYIGEYPWVRDTNAHGLFNSEYNFHPQRWGLGLYVFTADTYVPSGSWAGWKFDPPGLDSYTYFAELEASTEDDASTELVPASCIKRGIGSAVEGGGGSVEDCTWLDWDVKIVCTSVTCDPAVGPQRAYAYQQLETKQSLSRWGNKAISSLSFAKVAYSDRDWPSLSAFSEKGTIPWTKSWNTTLNGAVKDSGLGVNKVAVIGGTLEAIDDLECAGDSFDLCPAERPINLTIDSNQNLEGKYPIWMSAWDPIHHLQQKKLVEMQIDRSAPVIADPTGTLWNSRVVSEPGVAMAPGTYTLNMSATDGSTESDLQRRSGVKSIAVWVDDQLALAPDNKSCPASSCSHSRSWSFSTKEFSGGRHKITIIAEDQVGNESSRSFDVIAPNDTGSVLRPIGGTSTSRWMQLEAKAESAAYTDVKFQYRRLSEPWYDIPAQAMSDQEGVPLSSAVIPLSGKVTPVITWDLPATASFGFWKGPFDVRARFLQSGNLVATSKPVRTQFDPDGPSTDDATAGFGPGQLNLATGNLAVSAVDAEISTWAKPLTVNRTFNSRLSAASPTGPFGPGWVSSTTVDGVSDYAGIYEEEDPMAGSYVEVVGSTGGGIVFDYVAGVYKPEVGFESMTLTKPASDRFELKDSSGNTTVFSKHAGTVGGYYVPTEVREPGSANVSTVSYEVVNGTQRVKRISAPAPAGVSCANPATVGCRSLELIYASSTTASSDSEVGWGSYLNQLDRIEFTAYNPASSSMQTDVITRYLYGKSKRLMASWDPRISPELKTRYAYDAHGRLTTITLPGEPAWEIAYQEVGGKPESGRVKAVSRETPQGMATATAVYGLPVAGEGAPHEMGIDDVDAWGQKDVPLTATAIFPSDEVPADPPADYDRATISYLNHAGRQVNSLTPGGAIATGEYDIYGNVVRELSPMNRERALDAGSESAVIAQKLDTERTFENKGTEMKEELGPEHDVTLANGEDVRARARTVIVYDEGAPSEKDPHLPTTTRTMAKVTGGSETADEKVTKNEYNWTFGKPTKTINDFGGLNLTRTKTYNSTTGLETQSTMPKAGSRNRSTYYYAAGAGDCPNKPEWANLPCEVVEYADDNNGLPESLTTEYSYNRLHKVTKEAEDSGLAPETTTTLTYDSAGRSTGRHITNPKPGTGLVAAYGFEEASGSAVQDTSIEGNDGVIEGATRVPSGRFGKALSFDGTDDLVRVADSQSLDLYSEMTFEAWVKPDVIDSKVLPVLGRKPTTGICTTGAYVMYADMQLFGHVGPMGASCGTSLSAPNNQNLKAGTWSHLAFSVQGSDIRLQVNGAVVAATTGSPMSGDAIGDLLIGAFGESRFDGTIDEVRIYDRGLSASEVQYNMMVPVAAGPPPSPPSGLVAAYGFEELMETKEIEDSSPKDNHGELAFFNARVATGKVGAGLTPNTIGGPVPDSASLDLTTGITIEAWVKLDQIPVKPPAPVLATIAEKVGSYVFRILSDGTVEFAISTNGTTYNKAVTWPAITQAGKMTHWAATYDGQKLRLFRDGKEFFLSILAPGAAVPSNQYLRLPFGVQQGIVDELRIYNRALSAAEIEQDLTTPIAKPRPASRTNGAALPAVSYGYDPASGRLTTMSTTENGVTRTLTTGYDSLGRQTSYTDADGNTATTTYDLLGRPTLIDDGIGEQDLHYDELTGRVSEVEDSHAGVFTATYDREGRLISQEYPNGLTVEKSYDETGSAVDLEYRKGGTWYEEEVQSSIHGQWLVHDSSFSNREYTYDGVGRLTLVKDTPAGKGCTTRAYSYDANSNRLTKTVRPPAGGGACDVSSEGQVQSSVYDAADRVTTEGFEYDAFSRITGIPPSHSGGDPLRMSYYLNDMVRSQSQGGVKQGWLLDPTQKRHRATTPKAGKQDVLHYASSSDGPSWIAQLDGGEMVGWERSVFGIDGSLAGTVVDDGNEVSAELQLANLHGDIVATASADPGATEFTQTSEVDEFGVPLNGDAPRYGWLGSKTRRATLPSGVIQMGVRSYVPAMGRFTSVDPIPGGSANTYEYAMQDPINGHDLTGEAVEICLWNFLGNCPMRKRSAQATRDTYAQSVKGAINRGLTELQRRLDPIWRAVRGTVQRCLGGASLDALTDTANVAWQNRANLHVLANRKAGKHARANARALLRRSAKSIFDLNPFEIAVNCLLGP